MAATKRQPKDNPTSAVAVDMDAVMREHYEAVRRFAFSLTRGRRADADDVAQHAILVLYQNLASGREIPNVRMFLYQTARSTVVRFERSNRDLAPEWIHDNMRWTEAQSAEDDSLARLQVHRLLRSLPERSVELLLRSATGWTYRDIASDLSVSEASVKSALAHARSRLRQLASHRLDQLDPHPPRRQPTPSAPPLDAYEWIIGLDRVTERLRQTYTDTAAREWLVRPHPLLDDQRPIDLLRSGETRRVQGLIDAVAEGVFV